MKAQIQSGDVSNPKNIEEPTESARTGKLSASTMVDTSSVRSIWIIMFLWRNFIITRFADMVVCSVWNEVRTIPTFLPLWSLCDQFFRCWGAWVHTHTISWVLLGVWRIDWDASNLLHSNAVAMCAKELRTPSPPCISRKSSNWIYFGLTVLTEGLIFPITCTFENPSNFEWLSTCFILTCMPTHEYFPTDIKIKHFSD